MKLTKEKESVLLERDLGGQDAEPAVSIETHTEQTAEFVANLLPREKISSSVSEDDLSEFSATSDQAASDYSGNTSSLGINPAILPREEVMIKKIDSELKRRVKILSKKAKKLARHLSEGTAYELNFVVAKIRRLRQIIANLLSASFEYIKKLYVRLFMQAKKA